MDWHQLGSGEASWQIASQGWGACERDRAHGQKGRRVGGRAVSSCHNNPLGRTKSESPRTTLILNPGR
jgi:hypothetical protein